MAVRGAYISSPRSPTGYLLKGGRGGGGSHGHSSSSSSANWNAPPLVKTIFAFEIIWFIILLIVTLHILLRLKLVEKSARSSKAPYILAAFVSLSVSILYLLGAIQSRWTSGTTNTIDPQAILNIGSAITFLFTVDISFRPIVILWLCHLRGLLSAASAMTKHKNSFISSTWKKFVDWLFVVITLVAGVIYTGFSTYVSNAIYHGNVSTATQRQNYYNTLKIMSRVLIALIVLFAINIIVSLIALKVAQKRAKIADKVITRLLLISLPFVIIDAIEGPAAEIWMSTQTNYDTTLFSLILVIVEGTCRTMIFIGILFTMKLSSAPQAAHYGEYSAVSTGGQQPLLYHQQQASYPAPTPTPKYEGWTPTPSMYQQPPQGYPYQAPYGQPPAGAPWKQ